MLEAYVIQYQDGQFLALVNNTPNLVSAIADAKMFHTPTEAVLVQNQFNLQTSSTIQFVDIKLEEVK